MEVDLNGAYTTTHVISLSVICSYRVTPTWRMSLTHTEEVVGGEPLKVPDLQDEDGW